MAYSQLEPFGTDIEDQRMGMICASVLNAVLMVHSPKKGNIKWYQPADFIPEYGKEVKEPEIKKQTVDQMKDVLKAIAGVRND